MALLQQEGVWRADGWDKVRALIITEDLLPPRHRAGVPPSDVLRHGEATASAAPRRFRDCSQGFDRRLADKGAP